MLIYRIIGMSNHLLSIVFRFHYHSQQVSQNPTSPTKQIQGIENHFRRNPSPPNYLKVLESLEQKKTTQHLQNYSCLRTVSAQQKVCHKDIISWMPSQLSSCHLLPLAHKVWNLTVLSPQGSPRYVTGSKLLGHATFIMLGILMSGVFWHLILGLWVYSLPQERKFGPIRMVVYTISFTLPPNKNQKKNQPRKSSDDVPPARFAWGVVVGFGGIGDVTLGVCVFVCSFDGSWGKGSKGTEKNTVDVCQVLPSDLFGCFKWPPFGWSIQVTWKLMFDGQNMMLIWSNHDFHLAYFNSCYSTESMKNMLHQFFHLDNNSM